MENMTTKERILATVNHQPVDHLPLCVDAICHGGVNFAEERYPDQYERAKFYMDLGLDAGVTLHYPMWFPPKDVMVNEWREESADDQCPILFKEYMTPKGSLRQVVRKTEDYFDDSIPLFCDHNVPPARSKEYLVNKAEDLEKLAHILRPVEGKALDALHEEAKEMKKFCDEHQIIFSVYLWGVGDPMIWMSGVEQLLIAAMDDKEFVRQYAEIVAAWHHKTLEISIDAGVDHIIRRGWYESTDFWSPQLYEEFLLKPLIKDVETAHQAGVTLDYVMASGTMPLLQFFKKAGVDIYSNIDPMSPNTDVKAIREAIGDTVALCGGLNNYLVLEKGSEEDVRKAVHEAIDVFTPPVGCILAPSDSIFLGVGDQVERNFHVMIDTWKDATW